MHSQSQSKHIQYTAPDNLWRREINGAGERNMLDKSSISYKQTKLLIHGVLIYSTWMCNFFGKGLTVNRPRASPKEMWPLYKILKVQNTAAM